MVDYEKIQKQVGNMKTGEKKLIGAQYTAEEFWRFIIFYWSCRTKE